MVRIVETDADSGQICTGFDRPTRIGPTTVAPPSAWTSLVEMDAEWMAGMIRTLASLVRRMNGKFLVEVGSSARSGDISPSYSKSVSAHASSMATARRTRSDLRPGGLPKGE